MSYFKNSKAFTIIELMLAIVIIGIISTIIYINYSQESTYQATLTKAKAFATSVPISLPTSFAADWKFDGNTAINSPAAIADLTDAWGGNSGTIVSGVTVLGENDCMFGKCLKFNGTSDKISTSLSDGLLNQKANWTISAWVKPDSDGGKDCFFSEGYGTSTIFNACINNDNSISVSIYRGGALNEVSTSSSSVKISRGKWSYVLVSLKGGDASSGVIKFWLNGDMIFSASSQTKINYTATGNVQENIGTGVSGDYFKGAIDDIQIYSDYLPYSSWSYKDNSYRHVASCLNTDIRN